MVSYGDEVDVHDWGIVRILDGEKQLPKDVGIIYLVEEEDGSINWYVNPDWNSDTKLAERYAVFVRER